MKMLPEFASELGKVKGNLEKLWNLTKAEQLNRSEMRSIVLEIRKSERYTWNLLKSVLLQSTQKIKPAEAATYKLLTGKTPMEYIEDLLKQDPSEGTISGLLCQIDNPNHYNDKALVESVAGLVDSMEPMIDQTCASLGARRGLSKISEFVTLNPEFKQEWATAICYLSAMEITVNGKLKKLGLKKEGTFQESFSILLRELQNKGIEVSELEKTLPKVFWEIRNKVAHEGFSPTSDELELIMKYVTRFLNTCKNL